MQKPNNHKSVTPIPPPLNQRFRRGLLGEELKIPNGIWSSLMRPCSGPSKKTAMSWNLKLPNLRRNVLNHLAVSQEHVQYLAEGLGPE